MSVLFDVKDVYFRLKQRHAAIRTGTPDPLGGLLVPLIGRPVCDGIQMLTFPDWDSTQAAYDSLRAHDVNIKNISSNPPWKDGREGQIPERRRIFCKYNDDFEVMTDTMVKNLATCMAQRRTKTNSLSFISRIDVAFDFAGFFFMWEP